MKKLTCILLVAMFTMTSMLFAQITGGPIVEESDYLTITNKTTQESKKVPFNKFTAAGNNNYTYDVDFCLGVYQGDQIEITYKPEVTLVPHIAWSYFWNNDASYSLGTELTANLSVNNVPYNGSTLTATCNYQNGISGVSMSYNIHFKNVHNNTRFYSDYDFNNHLLRVTYRYYNEVSSCLTKAPYVAVYNSFTGIGVLNGSMDNNGIITFNTGSLSGSFIVKVTVNNVILPGEPIYLY